jgi:Zn-dependent oligopeptidase
VTELLKKLYYRSSLSTEEAIVAEKLAQEFEHNGINLEKNKLNQLYTLQDEIR